MNQFFTEPGSSEPPRSLVQKDLDQGQSQDQVLDQDQDCLGEAGESRTTP